MLKSVIFFPPFIFHKPRYEYFMLGIKPKRELVSGRCRKYIRYDKKNTNQLISRKIYTYKKCVFRITTWKIHLNIDTMLFSKKSFFFFKIYLLFYLLAIGMQNSQEKWSTPHLESEYLS